MGGGRPGVLYAPLAPRSGSSGFLGSSLGRGMNARNPGILEIRGCGGAQAQVRGDFEEFHVLGGFGAVALGLDITWLRDRSLRKLWRLSPTHLQEKGGGKWRGYCDRSLHTPQGSPCSSPEGSGLSLTWAEALTLLCGALGPLLGGAGSHPCPFL